MKGSPGPGWIVIVLFLCSYGIVHAGGRLTSTRGGDAGENPTQPVQGPGKIKSLRQHGQHLEILTEHAYVDVSVYSPSVVRVRMSLQPLGDDFSYAVVSKPQTTALQLTQTDSVYTLSTDTLDVQIRKAPFAVAFYTKDHKLINEDEPGLSTSWVGTSVTTYKRLQDGERFVGLGEKTGNVDHRGSGFTNWNEDHFGYLADQDPLYASFPFYIGLHHGLAYGIFLDNTYQTDFNFGASNNRFSSFGARGGEMNYYFFYRPSVAGLITAYTQLTGRMSLPPLWSLGYQQNRYSYYPDTEVVRIAATLREKHIPADGITLDIHYMNGYRVFSWDPKRFPDPKGLTAKLQAMGMRLTVIMDPGIKADTAYPYYKSGNAAGVFLHYPDGALYSGQVWPGWSVFTDFTSAAGRQWWRDQVRTYADLGVAGYWNDMNEISTWGQKVPDNVLFDYDGHATTMLQAHNVYGLEMARSSYEGAKAAMGQRPFVLSRSGYAGLQRYSALWTGDNRAEDDHMLAGVRLLQNLGLSGMAFTGMDVGGFTGNPTTELYSRWMQLGAFLPYFRNHTQNNTKSAEPWTFGEDVTDICRDFIDLRYTLLPYIYSTFFEATQDGLPVLRSLAIDYTNEYQIYDPRFQNQFTLGAAILVAPVKPKQDFQKVYLPKGTWYNLYWGSKLSGGQEMVVDLPQRQLPVFIKGGSILPMQSLVQSTSEKPSDTLTVHVYYGTEGGQFVYYEDDGISYGYEQGNYYKRSIRFDAAGHSIVWAPVEGKGSSKFSQIKLVLHGFDSFSGVKVNGVPVTVSSGSVSFITDGSQAPVQTCQFQNTNGKIELVY
jgi:alpha-glucosidase